jgi:hypothetical protein
MCLIQDDTWAILTIWQETRNEPDEVKLAVAEVLLRPEEAEVSAERVLRESISDSADEANDLALPHIAAWKKELLEARSKAEPTNTQFLALFARQARFER